MENSIFLNNVLYKAICKLFSNMKNKHFEVKVCTKQYANCLLKAVKTIVLSYEENLLITKSQKTEAWSWSCKPHEVFCICEKEPDREIRMLKEMRNYFLYK